MPGGFIDGTRLNGPTWSLLPELIGNFVYALVIRRLGMRLLSAFIGVGAAGLLLSVWLDGGFENGWAFDHYGTALSRVSFSFFAGVLVHRLHDPTRRVSNGLALTLMAIGSGCLLYGPPVAWRPIYELAVTMAVFPLLVAVACHVEPGRRLGRVTGSFLGLASYAVYVIHQPLGALTYAVVKRIPGVDVLAYPPASGVVFLIAVLAIAGVLDAVYDKPVRAWLTERVVRRRLKTGGRSPRLNQEPRARGRLNRLLLQPIAP